MLWEDRCNKHPSILFSGEYMSDQWGLPVLVFLCFLWWPIFENTKQYFRNTSSQYLWNNTKLSKHNTNCWNTTETYWITAQNYQNTKKLAKTAQNYQNTINKLGKHNTKLSKQNSYWHTRTIDGKLMCYYAMHKFLTQPLIPYAPYKFLPFFRDHFTLVKCFLLTVEDC